MLTFIEQVTHCHQHFLDFLKRCRLVLFKSDEGVFPFTAIFCFSSVRFTHLGTSIATSPTIVTITRTASTRQAPVTAPRQKLIILSLIIIWLPYKFSSAHRTVFDIFRVQVSLVLLLGVVPQPQTASTDERRHPTHVCHYCLVRFFTILAHLIPP